jgi:biotin carboxyl carrier protein
MPARNRTGDPGGDGAEVRTPAERAADHAALTRLADSLVPALVSKLGASSLGEIEIREDDWTIRVRRSAAVVGRRASDRPRPAAIPGHTGPHAPAAPGTAGAAGAAPAPAAGADAADETGAPRRSPALAPAVGVFRSGLAVGARVRAGDRIAAVDLLGIAQDVVAPIDGTLVEVHAQAGDGVEYGQELAVVEASARKPALAADGEA